MLPLKKTMALAGPAAAVSNLLTSQNDIIFYNIFSVMPVTVIYKIYADFRNNARARVVRAGVRRLRARGGARLGQALAALRF